MKKIKVSAISAVLGSVVLLGIGVTLAQDTGGPLKWGETSDPAVYLSVTFVDYKEGKAGEAYGIIANHYRPAAQAAELRPPVIVHFQTGPYDAAFHFRLEGGMSDLEWQRSPRNVKFRAALAAQEGSEEAAQAIFDRYDSLVARSVTSIGHRHIAEGEE